MNLPLPEDKVMVYKKLIEYGLLFVVLAIAIRVLWVQFTERQNALESEFRDRIKYLEKSVEDCDQEKKDRVESKIDEVLYIVKKKQAGLVIEKDANWPEIK